MVMGRNPLFGAVVRRPRPVHQLQKFCEQKKGFWRLRAIARKCTCPLFSLPFSPFSLIEAGGGSWFGSRWGTMWKRLRRFLFHAKECAVEVEGRPFQPSRLGAVDRLFSCDSQPLVAQVCAPRGRILVYDFQVGWRSCTIHKRFWNIVISFLDVLPLVFTMGRAERKDKAAAGNCDAQTGGQSLIKKDEG